ncbi:MAG: O-antigen ligase family protein [Candidatus Promineifilaceae bacterium]|nr:O-antigen ligase family protein [Candidatus Promineifilaceae bacterium]
MLNSLSQLGDVAGRRSTLLVVAVVVVLAAGLGYLASGRVLALVALLAASLLLLRQPVLGLMGLVVVALFVPIQFNTGTAVSVNVTVFAVPALLAIWIVFMTRNGAIGLVPSRTNRPLLLFVVAGLFSLLIGRVTWDPSVPRPAGFLVVQLAQWAIFALSAGAFLLAGNVIRDEVWLRRLTFFFLGAGGLAAIFYALPALTEIVSPYTTAALYRAPFWLLLATLGGGQFLFNRKLPLPWRLFFAILLGVAIYYTVVQQIAQRERSALSSFIGLAAGLGALIWLRFPRLRWPVMIVFAALAVNEVFVSRVYQFIGGEDEWFRSVGPRLALIGRVLGVTWRNPFTGLGPAAYRIYAGLEPLRYEHIVWIDPRVSSHNNYVDIFSHVGLIGSGLFLWFMAELGVLGWRLRKRFADGFKAAYVNGMLAAWVGIIVLMMTADWFLPFIYNISFDGFQASVLVWLFFGGLILLEQRVRSEGGQEPAVQNE